MPNMSITAPEDFFGFQLGADRKLARWDRIIDYLYQLQAESDRIKVVELGESTEGNPFLLTIISSADNLDNLERLRQLNLKLSDPRGLSEDKVAELVGEAKAVVCQSMSLHASEVGGTQMAPELAYDLLADNSEETLRILDNVVFLMVPCFNPDGQLMVTDWYRKWVDTEYEGCSLPWLYQKYTGHDNNRDAFMLNIPESQHMSRILFREWRPQAYQDHHHMGSYGARLYVAPYSEPIHPYADPLVWRELSWYGAHMAYKLDEAGKEGILNAAQFPGWGHLGFHWITNYHNIAGMLTESASARLASPLYIHPSQLKGASSKTMPEYEPQTNFPNPWEGGWWRLRDIVEQKKIAAWALLDLAARHRETVLWNAYRKAKRQVERGQNEEPLAFVVPPNQHDPLTVRKLVNVLLDQGIEVHQARSELTAGNRVFPAGTHVIFMQQPKRGLIMTLLKRTIHPDGYWNRTPEGEPIVFDTATDTVAEFMGVEAVALDERFEGNFARVEAVEVPAVTVPASTDGYVIDTRLNDAFTVVNRLLKKGAEVHRLTEPVDVGGESLPAGVFFVPGTHQSALEAAVEGLGVAPTAAALDAEVAMEEVQPLRVGMYQRYWGGNMDEGWTRWLFDTFELPYTTLRDEDINEDLGENYDVVILPSDVPPMMLGLEEADTDEYPYLERILRWIGSVDSVPPEYRSGFGEDGAEALQKFVAEGGRLVALDRATELVIDQFDLNVKNAVAELDKKTFFSHGNTLRVEVDTGHPLAYGMPEEAFVLSWDSPTFELLETQRPEDYSVVARYPKQDVLQSGWLIGEDKIAGKPALLHVKQDEGELVLVGFRTQHRGQMHGTFKFLFNCLF